VGGGRIKNVSKTPSGRKVPSRPAKGPMGRRHGKRTAPFHLKGKRGGHTWLGRKKETPNIAQKRKKDLSGARPRCRE